MRRPRAALAALLLLALAPRAGAVVGPSQDEAALSGAVVMVLNRVGHAAGFCSGLVVARQVVLTAAHCIPPSAALKIFYRDDAGQPVLLDITETARNPGYRPDAIRTRERSIDLALVRLAAPLPDRFVPAPLGEARVTPAGTAFRLAGFGLTREGEPASSGHLRVARLVAREPLSDLLLWARDPTARGAGACTGDSGGPVFAAETDTAVAITVWSAGPGKADCGLLTQAIWIGPQRPWIDATLKAWGLGG